MPHPHPLLLVAMLFAPCAAPRAADYCVLVSVASPVRSLSTKEAVGMYTGRTRQLATGELVVAVDLPRGDPTRERFFEALTGQPIARLNSHWARLQFSGQVPVPLTVPDAATLRATVRSLPQAIGYQEAPCQDAGLRAVLLVRG